MEIGCSNDDPVRTSLVDILIKTFNIWAEDLNSKFQSWQINEACHMMDVHSVSKGKKLSRMLII